MFKRLALVGTLLTVSQVSANHYGMAGCGVGALVFKDEPGKIQIVAATLNNIISPQTSAITSGTSGCHEAGSSHAQMNYIEVNKISLKADAARGEGETLDGLMTMMGCTKTDSVKSEIKNNFNAIFGTENANEIFQAIKKSQSVQTSCSILG